MARHQIIYTSCMRGIDGVNDGQQIFSYDEAFKDGKADEVKSLFTYQVPALPAGTLMSEEIALTMPVAFSYRLLKNGSASVTLNTYLGRDYMGSAGRFGNHLSHSVVCDFSDFDVYPCELYASTTLRSSMEYVEVNNPDPPAYLPTPELITGYVIDPDSIIEFLGIADNLERYKQMVTAMLRFQTEKKRIVICDEPENIAKWIAALHYTLPLDIAKKVNFTTYEFDPELSPSQICGVVSEGTRYNCGNYISSNRHYVFDFINNQFTSIDADNVMMDFLDTAFSFSYDSLTDFHSFVLNSTIYRECNDKYYAAYYLYNLLSEGISDITKDQFSAVTGFASEYLTDDVKRELIFKLLDEQYNINQLENDYALLVLGYMLQSLKILDASQQRMVKQMIVNRLILSLSTDGITEDAFLPLYDNIDNMARSINLSIPAELMVDNNRDSLLGVLSQNAQLWKVYFVVRIISDYVKDMRISTDELYPNRAIGAIYFGVVDSVYRTGRNNGYIVVERILEGFKDNFDYYVNMALNIEGFLNDLNLTEADTNHLWEYFYDEVLKMDATSIEEINKKLAEYDRFDEMYALYEKQLKKFAGLAETRDYFESYWSRWFVRNRGYGQAYAAIALKAYEGIYERKIGTVPDKEQFEYASEILNMAMEMGITDDYVRVLCEAVLEYIPMGKLNDDNRKTISELYKYNREVLNKPIDGKLLLFVISLQLNKITKKADIVATVQKIKSVAGDNGAKFEGMTEGKIKDYFEWAFDSLGNFSLSKDDYDAIYSLFDFTNPNHTLFMEYWCKASYKESKGDKDYSDFAEFLRFMFEMGRLNDQDMVGRYLCKLSKTKLEDLNVEMQTVHFKEDRKCAHAWSNVRDIADSTNPLLNNLSNLGNLFKKK